MRSDPYRQQQQEIPNGRYNITGGEYDVEGNFKIKMTVVDVDKVIFVKDGSGWSMPEGQAFVSLTITKEMLEMANYEVDFKIVGKNKKAVEVSYTIKRQADIKPAEPPKKENWLDKLKKRMI